MDTPGIYDKLSAIESEQPFALFLENDSEQSRRVANHAIWLRNIRSERPSTAKQFKVAVYIRYFNQTKYENYLDFHKKQYLETMALCPKWKFVGFYIDEGSTAPNMESAPEWSRLLSDCMDGKIDLIITQKVSNVSKKIYEIIFCARLLAAQKHPIGIYFVSEDLFTLASYYQEDLRDTFFMPTGDWKMIPDEEDDTGGRLCD